MGVVFEPPPGIRSVSPFLPSVWMWVDRTCAPVSLSVTTAAPAPSPQRIQLSLSCQFITLVMISEPITRAVLFAPAFISLSATWSAKINPEHAAVISKETAFSQLSFASSQFDPAGQWVSGVMVARIIRSMSPALPCASLRAHTQSSTVRHTRILSALCAPLTVLV